MRRGFFVAGYSEVSVEGNFFHCQAATQTDDLYSPAVPAKAGTQRLSALNNKGTGFSLSRERRNSSIAYLSDY
jgi:hypothetical protein